MTRFVHVDETEIERLKVKETSASTKKGTSNALKTFLSFCTEENVYSVNVISLEELRGLLTRFYAGARTVKGEYYKVNMMHSLRNGLRRHFKEVRKIDITNDGFFEEANMCFSNMLKKIKGTNKGQVQHYAEIEPEDLRHLYRHLVENKNTPAGLLQKVWVDIMLYFIRRGRENLRDMSKNTFVVGVDASGTRYVEQATGEVDKNHPDPLGAGNDDTNGEGRMYATGRDSCPVESYLKYIALLNPNQEAFWQRPKTRPSTDAPIWYDNAPLGEKSLGGMMATLSTKYKLSQRYTNHCIRVTTVQALDDHNIAGRHIVRVSGHKSEESIKSYARKLSAAKKRKISSVLSTIVDDGNGQLPPATSVQEPEKVPLAETATAAHTSDTDYFSNDTDDGEKDLAISAMPPPFVTVQVDKQPALPAVHLPSLPPLPSFFSQNQPIFYGCSNITVNYNYSK